MTVEKLINTLAVKPLAVSDSAREIEGAYIGDLLSWVMGRAKQNDAWITIMSNINIIAVASLADTACIILAEGVVPEQNVIDTANAKGINLLTTELTAYELAVKLSELIGR